MKLLKLLALIFNNFVMIGSPALIWWSTGHWYWSFLYIATIPHCVSPISFPYIINGIIEDQDDDDFNDDDLKKL
jgi:hypothetical protein